MFLFILSIKYYRSFIINKIVTFYSCMSILILVALKMILPHTHIKGRYVCCFKIMYVPMNERRDLIIKQIVGLNEFTYKKNV